MIEFSKLTDIEKHYLAENVHEYKYRDGFIVREDVGYVALNEVENSLIEKGWLISQEKWHLPIDKRQLVIQKDFEIFFRDLGKLERIFSL